MSVNADQSELQNGGPDPQASVAPLSSDTVVTPEPPSSDPEATDAPPDSEPDPNIANAQPVNTEASPEEEILLSDVDSRAVQSNEAKLAKSAGNRTFTMRELLNELKNGDPDNDDAREVDTPHSEPISEQQTEQNTAAMKLINSVNCLGEEGRSRQKVLTFAARRYANALERNPEDYDALYNWALVLQLPLP